MLLQKAGLRLKQFISPRKGPVDECVSAPEIPERTMKRPSSPHSWMRQRTRFIDEDANSSFIINIVDAPRTEPSPIPSLKTAHLFVSSLCSCDCNSNTVSTPHSLSIAASAQSSLNAFYLDFPDPSLTREDAKKWTHTLSDVSPDSVSLTRSLVSVAAPTSTLNIFEALSMEPNSDNTTPTQKFLDLETTPTMQWSDNVEQLIRETDRAFKAVDFALTEAKEAAQDCGSRHDTESKGGGIAKPATRKKVRMPTTRHVSVSKPKRRKTSKPKVKHSKRQTLVLQTFPPPITPNPRWTLTEVTENMAGLFGGRVFGRPDVNKILEPGLSGQHVSEQDAKPKQSYETASSCSTDEILTPVEPFHLDDLSSRLGSTKVVSDVKKFASPTLLNAPPVPNKNGRRIVEPVSLNTDLKPNHDPPLPRSPQAFLTNPLQFENLKFPSLPHRSPRSRSVTRASNLETISEISPVTPNKCSLARSSVSSGKVSPLSPTIPGNEERKGVASLIHTAIQQDFQKKSKNQTEVEDLQLLESTPYSMNSPLFRHGSIRLNKAAELGNPIYDSSESGTLMSIGAPRRNENERPAALDWTAFQMAISGGAGDFLMSGEGVESRLEMMQELEKEVDEILEWWDGFGFSDKDGGYGKLVREKTSRKKSSAKGTQDAVHGRSRGYTSELPGGTGRGKFQEAAMDNWEASHITESNDRRGSAYGSDCSLPDSPMDQISPESKDKGGSIVLMGFNLGHDLPDFLKWEAEHGEGLAGT